MLPNGHEITVYKFSQKIRDELDAYSREGKLPSAFIGQVLSNNLILTLTNMSQKQAPHLNEILQYINNELPADSYGCASNVDSWLAWKADKESQPLSVYQLKMGLDTKTQIRALEQALKLSTEVVRQVSESVQNPNLKLIHQKCSLVLQNQFEDSLAIKLS